MRKIIGLMMVKNEDIYIGQAIRCIKNFCDEIIVVDTGSTDDTIAIAQAEGVTWYIETDLSKTHRFCERYVGTDTWLFGVDGDEIYDPEGLDKLKRKMQAGYYEGAYQVQGQYLHALDIGGDQVTGHLGPPSHTPGKLYNMCNIIAWPSDGQHILFLSRGRLTDGAKMRAQLDTWDASFLRCVHTRFLKRSSKEDPVTRGKRLHGEDILGFGNRSDRGGTDKVNERLIYRQGPIVTKKVNWLGV